MPYDILDDPRYDTTPGVQSISVARSPIYISHSRKKLLRLIGLPSTATWEDANPILKQRIVTARQAGDDEAATKWSVLRDELENKLAHYCECGELIRSGGIQCGRCHTQSLCQATRKPGWWRDNLLFRGQLGKQGDTKIARRWKISRSSVWRLRKKYGIPAYDCFAGEDDGNREYLRRKWPEEVISKLGTVPDSTIENLYGYHLVLVRAERKIRKIPPFQPLTKHPFRKRYRTLMGTMTDGALAKLANIPRRIVTYHRNKAGIPPFQKMKIPAE